MSAADPEFGKELWRGIANAWECDHLRHLNVRHFFGHAETGCYNLLLLNGCSADTWSVRSVHSRFLREAKAGAPLHLEGAITSGTADMVQMAFVLWHSRDEQPAATFQISLVADDSGGKAVSENLPEIPPAQAEFFNKYGPRSLNPQPDDQDMADMRTAIGMKATAMTSVTQRDVIRNGLTGLDTLMGIISDAVPHAPTLGWRDVQARSMIDADNKEAKIVSALAEARLTVFERPRIGDILAVQSVPTGCTDKVMYSAYAIVDTVTERIFALAQTAGIPIDLNKRKFIRLSHEAQQAYRQAALSA